MIYICFHLSNILMFEMFWALTLILQFLCHGRQERMQCFVERGMGKLSFWRVDKLNKQALHQQTLHHRCNWAWHSISLWFCPHVCPCPHFPHVLPPAFALALYFALIFQGKIEGKGKRWGQNIGEMGSRAKLNDK